MPKLKFQLRKYKLWLQRWSSKPRVERWYFDMYMSLSADSPGPADFHYHSLSFVSFKEGRLNLSERYANFIRLVHQHINLLTYCACIGNATFFSKAWFDPMPEQIDKICKLVPKLFRKLSYGTFWTDSLLTSWNRLSGYYYRLSCISSRLHFYNSQSAYWTTASAVVHAPCTLDSTISGQLFRQAVQLVACTSGFADSFPSIESMGLWLSSIKIEYHRVDFFSVKEPNSNAASFHPSDRDNMKKVLEKEPWTNEWFAMPVLREREKDIRHPFSSAE